jgi:signal transduction histidine kinase
MSPLFGKTALTDDVLKPVLESLEPELNARGITVENDVPRNMACNADLNMVREVFENLLSNAVKYGREQGRITVKAETRDGMALCHVWNEGEGIAEDQIPKLFGKFARLGQQRQDQRDKGTGLGLFITRQIVEAHGGTIHVESEPGEWVDFCFTLPLWDDSREANPPENEP